MNKKIEETRFIRVVIGAVVIVFIIVYGQLCNEPKPTAAEKAAIERAPIQLYSCTTGEPYSTTLHVSRVGGTGTVSIMDDNNRDFTLEDGGTDISSALLYESSRIQLIYKACEQNHRCLQKK